MFKVNTTHNNPCHVGIHYLFFLESFFFRNINTTSCESGHKILAYLQNTELEDFFKCLVEEYQIHVYMLISYFALDTTKFWQMMMNRANIVCYMRTHQRIWACRKGRDKTNTEEVTGQNVKTLQRHLTQPRARETPGSKWWRLIGEETGLEEKEKVYSKKRECSVQKPREEKKKPCVCKEIKEVEQSWSTDCKEKGKLLQLRLDCWAGSRSHWPIIKWF